MVQRMSFNREGKKEGRPFVFGPELAIAKMPADKPSAYCFFSGELHLWITCTGESKFWVNLVLAEDKQSTSKIELELKLGETHNFWP